MAAHGVAGDGPAVRRQWKLALDQPRQLLDDVIVHAVVLLPGRLRGVDIKSGAEAKIPGTFGVIRHSLTARACIRADDGQTVLRSVALGSGLLGEIFICAGKPG